jgi:N-acetylglucosamine malate deacetylase 1
MVMRGEPLMIACDREAPAGGSGGCAQSAVLIVSPHPDDDVLGAGGMMALLAESGRQVYSAYVTSGAPPDDPEMGGRRQREAVRALRVVGARAGFFLRQPGDGLRRGSRAEAVQLLRAVLDRLQPGAVYVPSPFERHPTHIAATLITIEALRRRQKPVREIWGYSVWSDMLGLPGTRPVDISRVAARKRQAIHKHASQLACKPYHQGMLGRNCYEGVYGETHARRHCACAEVFLDMRALLGPRPWTLQAYARSVMTTHLRQIYAVKA